jgi:hypothetical protein
MTSICVLKIPNAKSRVQEHRRGSASSDPISLLAFLEAENRRLQDMVVQLKRDTLALRQALPNN